MKSVVVLCLDAFRYDLISQELTPNLYRATQESENYNNCQSGNSTTILSMPVLLCGEKKYLPGLSIPARIKRFGAKSYMLSANSLVDREFNQRWTDYFSFTRGKVGIDKDFDKRKNLRRVIPPLSLPPFIKRILKRLYRQFSDPESYLVYDRCETIMKAAEVIMEDPSQKFIWLQLMETHQPYYPLKALEKEDPQELIYVNDLQIDAARGWIKLDDKTNQKLWELYRMEAAYLDEQIGKFLDKIDFEKTTIIITADHGEEFGEHGQWGHRADKFVPELVHVPLIILNGKKQTNIEDIDHYKFSDIVIREMKSRN
jgi:membrane-anchored protein YejM (alkaline phosphatase superfamily)